MLDQPSGPAGERGELVWDEFAHAIEYLMYAYLQQGAERRLHAVLTVDFDVNELSRLLRAGEPVEWQLAG